MTLPDLDSLRCFLAVVQHRSFRAGAAAVALSPSAFSERVRRLEDEIGVAVFERTTRAVRLTPAGEALLPHARACVDAAERCARVAHAAAPYGLSVGTRFELGLSWLVPALDALAERRPERTLHLQFGTDRELLRLLDGGTLDAVISSVRIANQGLATAPLHEERYVLVAAPTLGAAEVVAADPTALTRYPLVDADPSLPLLRYLLDARAELDAVDFPRVEYHSTIAAIRARILAGRGIAVLPEYFVATDLARGDLVRLRPDWAVRADQFRLLWKPGHLREGDLRALADDLRSFELR